MSTITISINGQFVSKSGKNAGAAGSANTTQLRFVFDESWRGYAKRVIWRDSKGGNETSVILVPDVAESSDQYSSYIPGEATQYEGWCSFTVEGYYKTSPERVMKSAGDRLFVGYSDVNAQITPLTPGEALQLQAEFENLMPRVNTLMEDTVKSVADAIDSFNVWENYSDERIYERGNKVVFDGCCYVCLKQSCGVSPENDDFWLMIASRGLRGQTGNQGPQGIRGEQGIQGEKGNPGDKGDTGEKGEQGERGINGSCVPSNGFYTFSVDEDGDLWIHYPDGSNPPAASLNEDGELILSVGEEESCSFNVGSVKGEAFTYSDFTEEQKKELLTIAIPEIAEVNKAADSAQTAAGNARASEENAAESEANAVESELAAAQAMEDLLSMINSGDIVLATDGKLPLSAIPATATQEIYTVTSEDELTSLTAQRGDLAELIEEIDGEQTITKTWQCLGDASVRDNWVIWGTSYAVQAGNAATADNASNANMINNHRIVEMTAEEFENAVKNEDTYYFVY